MGMEREDNRPLVAFTTLAPLSAGGIIGLLLVRGQAVVPSVDWGAVAVLAVALLALAASCLHLGHPFRAYRAISGVATSWLSREVILFSIFVLLLAGYTLPWFGDVHIRQFYGTCGAAAGFLTVIATGKVYHLPSHPAWNHWSTVAVFPLGALSAGVAFGVFASGLAQQAGSSARGGLSSAVPLAVVFLAVALVVGWIRLRRLRDGNEEERAAWQLAMGTYRWALLLRMVAVGLAAVLLVAGSLPAAFAWIMAALGEMADRVLLFYAVVPVSPRDRAGVPRFTPVPVPEAVAPPMVGQRR